MNNLIKDLEALKRAVDGFPGARLMVVGDLMVDEFIWGRVERISPEAPVPVVEVHSESLLLGGSANVLNNVVALGGGGRITGVVGDDLSGKSLLEMLGGLGCDTAGVTVAPDWVTTVKTRIIAHRQQVVRLDRERKDGVDSGVVSRTLAYVESGLSGIDGVVVADYGKGFVTGELMDGLRRLVEGTGVFLGVDPKVDNFELYTGVSFLTPNHFEAGRMYGKKVTDEASLLEVGEGLLRHLGLDFLLITRGERGMSLFEKDKDPVHIPTVAKEVFDVTGAGDTVIAVLALGLAAGLSPAQAAALSNVAAGLVVGMVGTATVTPAGLKKAIGEALSARSEGR